MKGGCVRPLTSLTVDGSMAWTRVLSAPPKLSCGAMIRSYLLMYRYSVGTDALEIFCRSDSRKYRE